MFSRTTAIGLASVLTASTLAATSQVTYRSAVDLVTVDALVVDRAGVPVGVLGSDRFEADVPGGRPQVDDIARTLGTDLARANAVIYALQIDTTMRAMFSATQQRVSLSTTDVVREASLMGRWLEQLSVASGGALLRVQTDDGERAMEQVLRETSAFYILGVEPEAGDRDGRLRELRVRVRERGVTVRHRSWVIVPERKAA